MALQCSKLDCLKLFQTNLKKKNQLSLLKMNTTACTALTVLLILILNRFYFTLSRHFPIFTVATDLSVDNA